MRSGSQWKEEHQGVLPSATSSPACTEVEVFDEPLYNSQSTAPTQFSLESLQNELADVQKGELVHTHCREEDPRDSECTYASTLDTETDSSTSSFSISSAQDLTSSRHHRPIIPAPLASTPRTFAQFFPTKDRLLIRHDDTTLDGNMNLRLDTILTLPNGRKRPLTLFHLRMHDLKSRDFSLRRYCRESGREICHSARQYTHEKRTGVRPALQRSLSSALATLRRANSSASSRPPARRASTFSTSPPTPSSQDCPELEDDNRLTPRPKHPTNVIKLEFSNYAHIDVTRCSTSSNLSWKFDYWGHSYTWKRQIDPHGQRAFRLFKSGSEFPVAHIMQDVLTTAEAEEERRLGGWVPPCSLWVTEDGVLGRDDVADVVIATGLIALVDDSIKTKWPSTSSAAGTRTVFIPLASTKYQMGWDYIGPKELIDQLFNPDRRQMSIFRWPYRIRRAQTA